MTPSSLIELTRRHETTLAAVDRILSDAKLSPAEGEALLLFLAGLSAGQRQQSIKDPEWLQPMAVAWGFAAEMGDELDD